MVFHVAKVCAKALAVSALLETASAAPSSTSSSCKVLPGDSSWPSSKDWTQLNSTVQGRLIKTVPVASVCHTAGIANYDEAACKHLSAAVKWPRGEPYYETRLNLTQTYWDEGQTFLPSPADMMNPYYQNQTCDPWTASSKPCALGNMAVYSINVTGAADAIAGVKFAQAHNVRVQVKNSGHDYMGKSSGQGSLGLWTHNLNSKQIITNYKSASYSGPAAKFGAGVSVGDAMEFVKNKYRVVGGECGTVGIAGGYSQGGGHSILNSAYGLAADQVLEWEVVTGEGQHVIATPEKNTDLYFALSGGGGGTYGVVISMTSKLHAEGPVAGASLTFYNTNVTNATYWDAVTRWFQYLPNIVHDSHNTIQFVVWNDQMAAQSINLVDHNVSAVHTYLNPFLKQLDGMGVTYNLTTHQSKTYYDHFDHYYGPLPDGIEPASTMLDSSLVPNSILDDGAAVSNLTDAIKLTVESGEFLVGCTAMDANVTHPNNAVLPAWRETIGVCIMNAFWNYTAPVSQNLEVKTRMNEVYQPAMEAATGSLGVYLNEMDPLYIGDWKHTMYGDNYNRLLDIKHKHDPHHLFYGHFAVGSDEFSVDGSGRLCYDS